MAATKREMFGRSGLGTKDSSEAVMRPKMPVPRPMGGPTQMMNLATWTMMRGMLVACAALARNTARSFRVRRPWTMSGTMTMMMTMVVR